MSRSPEFHAVGQWPYWFLLTYGQRLTTLLTGGKTEMPGWFPAIKLGPAYATWSGHEHQVHLSEVHQALWKGSISGLCVETDSHGREFTLKIDTSSMIQNEGPVVHVKCWCFGFPSWSNCIWLYSHIERPGNCCCVTNTLQMGLHWAYTGDYRDISCFTSTT